MSAISSSQTTGIPNQLYMSSMVSSDSSRCHCSSWQYGSMRRNSWMNRRKTLANISVRNRRNSLAFVAISSASCSSKRNPECHAFNCWNRIAMDIRRSLGWCSVSGRSRSGIALCRNGTNIFRKSCSLMSFARLKNCRVSTISSIQSSHCESKSLALRMHSLYSRRSTRKASR